LVVRILLFLLLLIFLLLLLLQEFFYQISIVAGILQAGINAQSFFIGGQGLF